VEADLYMVRRGISPADNAVYISTHSITREQCGALVKDGKSKGWDGIVWVGRYVPAWEMEMAYWGDMGRRVDGVLLYGDPVLLEEMLRRAGR
jgi:hypothetical protein